MIDVLRFVLRPCQPQRQPQHSLVVAAHEVLEGSAVSALSLPHQNGVVYAVQTLSGHLALTGTLTPSALSRRISFREPFAIFATALPVTLPR